MNEHELLVDCLHRLNRTGIAYYVTGSMASNFWGIPRTTHDLDFVVQIPPNAIPKIVAEFSSDFYIEETAVRAAYSPPHQFNAIDTRSSLKVDFWLPRAEPFDREMFSRRTQVMFSGVTAWIATPEDVILHKLVWNQMSPSERQLGDAAGIRAVQGERLDNAYLQRWAAELDVQESLRRILSGEIRPKIT